MNEPEIVKALLNAGANPNLLDRNGCSSLHLAVCKQFYECLDVVCSCTRIPAVINSRDYEGEWSGLLIFLKLNRKFLPIYGFNLPMLLNAL